MRRALQYSPDDRPCIASVNPRRPRTWQRQGVRSGGLDESGAALPAPLPASGAAGVDDSLGVFAPPSVHPLGNWAAQRVAEARGRSALPNPAAGARACRTTGRASDRRRSSHRQLGINTTRGAGLGALAAGHMWRLSLLLALACCLVSASLAAAPPAELCDAVGGPRKRCGEAVGAAACSAAGGGQGGTRHSLLLAWQVLQTRPQRSLAPCCQLHSPLMPADRSPPLGRAPPARRRRPAARRHRRDGLRGVRRARLLLVLPLAAAPGGLAARRVPAGLLRCKRRQQQLCGGECHDRRPDRERVLWCDVFCCSSSLTNKACSGGQALAAPPALPPGAALACLLALSRCPCCCSQLRAARAAGCGVHGPSHPAILRLLSTAPQAT